MSLGSLTPDRRITVKPNIKGSFITTIRIKVHEKPGNT